MDYSPFQAGRGQKSSNNSAMLLFPTRRNRVVSSAYTPSLSSPSLNPLHFPPLSSSEAHLARKFDETLRQGIRELWSLEETIYQLEQTGFTQSTTQYVLAGKHQYLAAQAVRRAETAVLNAEQAVEKAGWTKFPAEQEPKDVRFAAQPDLARTIIKFGYIRGLSATQISSRLARMGFVEFQVGDVRDVIRSVRASLPAQSVVTLKYPNVSQTSLVQLPADKDHITGLPGRSRSDESGDGEKEREEAVFPVPGVPLDSEAVELIRDAYPDEVGVSLLVEILKETGYFDVTQRHVKDVIKYYALNKWWTGEEPDALKRKR